METKEQLLQRIGELEHEKIELARKAFQAGREVGYLARYKVIFKYPTFQGWLKIYSKEEIKK